MNGPSIPDVYQIFVKAVSLFPAFTLNDVMLYVIKNLKDRHQELAEIINIKMYCLKINKN